MRSWCVEKPKRSALLPFVHGVGLGEECPAHSVSSLSLLDRETLAMYAMLGKKWPLFLRRYYWCTFMSSATKCKRMCWEYLWNHVLIFCVYAMLVDNYFDSRLVKGQFGASCLWHLELIIGLEASQWNCNILLACISSIHIDSKLHLWLSHYGL